MTDKCQAEQRFDLQLTALKEFVILKIAALQAEYSKSELNYPTRQLLDERLMGLVSKDDIEEKYRGLSLQMKLQWAFLVGLLIMFLTDYLRD